jgi:hypothetical protein
VTASASALGGAVQHDLFWQSSDTLQIYNRLWHEFDIAGKSGR